MQEDHYTPIGDSNQRRSFSKLQVLSLFLCGSALVMYKQPFTGAGNQNMSDVAKTQEDTFKPELTVRSRNTLEQLRGGQDDLTSLAYSSSSCSNTVDILKKGPADIAQYLSTGQQHTDYDFNESESGIEFLRWPTVNGYKNNNIFDDGTVHFTEANQGGLGNCYFISAIATVAEWPNYITDMFVSGTDNNGSGIYGIKFYIRGKPWIVSIDDKLAFNNYYSQYQLRGVNIGEDSNSMWAPLLEKAWAKVKGSSQIAGSGGFIQTGLRSILGVPVFGYQVADISGSSGMDEVFDLFTQADLAGYPMGMGTSGGTSDQQTNDCGIARMHAYSIITTFKMTDSSGTEYKMVMIRNPWGLTRYTGQFSATDYRWTSSLISQVPFGLDPTTSADIGIFVMPITLFANRNIDCVTDYQIGHLRTGEGYTDDWFDVEDENNYQGFTGEYPSNDETQQEFSITVPRNNGDLYFTAESYYSGMVPENCQGSYGSPLLLFELYKGQYNRLEYKYYPDQLNYPIMVQQSDYSAGDTFTLKVGYKWYTNPVKDYTVKVYSSQTLAVKDSNGNTNQIHMDGQSPSGFTSSSYTGMGSFNIAQGQDNNDDQNTHPDTAGSDTTDPSAGSGEDVLVDMNSIPIQTMLTELKSSFKAMREARVYGFQGLEFTTATTLISEMVERYGKSSFIQVYEIEAIVESCDTDGDGLLFKTEFLICGKVIGDKVNALVM